MPDDKEALPGPDDVVTLTIGGKEKDIDPAKRRVVDRGAGKDTHPLGSGRSLGRAADLLAETNTTATEEIVRAGNPR